MKANLVGVNRFLTQEVERISYRHIDMRKLRSRQRFIAALEADRRRGTYVRTLVIGSDDATDLVPTRGLAIFNSFVNISSLTIHQTSNTVSTNTILKRCHFPHLIHFGSSWSLNDPAFRVFLSRHPTLKSIGLRKSFSMAFGMPTSFPPTLLPALEDLDGHWSNIVRLIEGRPVSRVAMSSANSDSYLSRHKLVVILPIVSRSASAAGVERLTIHVQQADAELVTLVAQSLPSLRRLCLVNSSSDPVSTDAAMQEVHALQALAQFDALEEFGVNWPALDVLPRRAEVLASVNPALRRLIFQDDVWVRGTLADEWRQEVAVKPEDRH